MSQTELVKQCLRFEIGNPDGRDLAVPDGLTVDDLDDRGGAHNTLVDDRVDVAVFGDNADVAEPREIEHIGKTGSTWSRKSVAPVCVPPQGR
jgi:hypothetical protein